MATPFSAGSDAFFGQMKRSFRDVPMDAARDNAIATTEFLDAAESVTKLFGEFHRLNSFA